MNNIFSRKTKRNENPLYKTVIIFPKHFLWQSILPPVYVHGVSDGGRWRCCGGGGSPSEVQPAPPSLSPGGTGSQASPLRAPPPSLGLWFQTLHFPLLF